MSIASVCDLQRDDVPGKSFAARHILQELYITAEASGMLVSCEGRTGFRLGDS